MIAYHDHVNPTLRPSNGLGVWATNPNSNIAERVIAKGLASAVRHKRDDENRSPDYDKRIAAEQA